MKKENEMFILPLIGIVGLLSLVGIATTAASSCGHKEVIEKVIEEPTKEKVGKFEIHRIKKDGHTYLFFDMPKRTGMGGVVHDAACPCHKTNQSPLHDIEY